MEPSQLLQTACETVAQFVPSSSGAYAALVAEPEEPDWVPPEDDETAGIETDDEAAAPPVEGEGDGEAAEDAPPAEDGEAPADGEGGEPAAPKPQKPMDYSKKYLAYVAATNGQDFVKDMDLRRPAPLPEDVDPDDPEAPKPEPMPISYRILDEIVPLVYVPSVAKEPRVRFFKQFPKIGAYIAAGVQMSSSKEFKAVLAADSLFPEAGGQPLNEEDKDFIWEASRAVSSRIGAAAGAAPCMHDDTCMHVAVAMGCWARAPRALHARSCPSMLHFPHSLLHTLANPCMIHVMLRTHD